jgi:hypothetical protein
MSGIPKPDPEAPVQHLCAMSRHGRAESRYLMPAVTNMEVPIARGVEALQSSARSTFGGHEETSDLLGASAATTSARMPPRKRYYTHEVLLGSSFGCTRIAVLGDRVQRVASHVPTGDRRGLVHGPACCTECMTA